MFAVPPGLQRGSDGCWVVVSVQVAEWVPASFLQGHQKWSPGRHQVHFSCQGTNEPRRKTGCQTYKQEERAGWVQQLFSRAPASTAHRVMLEARQVVSQYVGHSRTCCHSKCRRAQLKKSEIKPVSDLTNQLQEQGQPLLQCVLKTGAI